MLWSNKRLSGCKNGHLACKETGGVAYVRRRITGLPLVASLGPAARSLGAVRRRWLPLVASFGPSARSLAASPRHWLPPVASLGLRPGHWALCAVIGSRRSRHWACGLVIGRCAPSLSRRIWISALLRPWKDRATGRRPSKLEACGTGLRLEAEATGRTRWWCLYKTPP